MRAARARSAATRNSPSQPPGPQAVPGDRLIAHIRNRSAGAGKSCRRSPRASAGRPGSIPCRQAGPALPARRRRNCGGGCELGCSPARAGHHPASALDAPRHSRRQAPRRRRSAAAAGAGAIGRAEADGRLRARPAFNCLPSVRAEGDDAQHVLKNLEMAKHGSSPCFNPAIRARLANRFKRAYFRFAMT